MIDHLAGRPNPSWKRAQVFLVIIFWLWRIIRGRSGPPRILFLPRVNRALQRFTPWQIILSTLTTVYAVRNLDHILGLTAPEPLARLYSASYYRATWIVTGLDAGFATAMTIRPKWLRDIASIIFTIYYIIYAQEADEKLRKYRAVPTVEMLRTTWEKTTNPYLRFITNLKLPRLGVRRKVLLPRPNSSSYDRPITAWLYFAPSEGQLSKQTELILDFPGGGFIAMQPEHHEERLRSWAVTSGRPILSIDYGKAPEYPYPFAIDEAYDTYKVLVESNGSLIGMSGQKLSIIVHGDSAGGTMAINVVIKVVEQRNMKHPRPTTVLPVPLAVVLSYPALDFNFTSWMAQDHLRVLRSEQSSGNLPGMRELAEQKDHLKHISPLSMVRDSRPFAQRKKLKRRSSWKDALRDFASGGEDSSSSRHVRRSSSNPKLPPQLVSARNNRSTAGDEGNLGDAESDEEDANMEQYRREEDRPIRARVKYKYPHGDGTRPKDPTAVDQRQHEMLVAVAEANSKAIQSMNGNEGRAPNALERVHEPIGTRLTMTSRTGYFQDRVISPSMMRAMAILYIGPHRNPDFSSDYHISPLLTPDWILAQFPPILLQCGEKDPFVDDTVIFAGRIREAKRARKTALDLALSGKSARFGETLRMSTNDPTGSFEGRTPAELKRERDKLASETESDWVHMILFSDWSHGYLQMPTLMSEAQAVIDDLAEWMDNAFEKYGTSSNLGANGGSGKGKAAASPRHTPSPPQTFQVPQALMSETETETDDLGITLVPKRAPRRLTPPTSVKTSDNSNSDSSATIVPPSLAKAKMEASGASEKASPRLAGQTITEGELIARRRLQDAHLFEQK